MIVASDDDFDLFGSEPHYLQTKGLTNQEIKDWILSNIHDIQQHSEAENFIPNEIRKHKEFALECVRTNPSNMRLFYIEDTDYRQEVWKQWEHYSIEIERGNNPFNQSDEYNQEWLENNTISTVNSYANIYDDYDEAEPYIDENPFEFFKVRAVHQSEDNWEMIHQVVSSYRKHQKEGTLPTEGPFSKITEKDFLTESWHMFDDTPNIYYHQTFIMPEQEGKPQKDVLEVIEKLSYVEQCAREMNQDLVSIDMDLDGVYEKLKLAEQLQENLKENGLKKKNKLKM